MTTYQAVPLLTARRMAWLATHRQPLRVLMVDDHPAVRAGLEGILEAEPDLVCVATVATAGDALAQTQRLSPDVVVVDYHLPDQDGLSLTLELKALNPPPRVLIYSAYADTELTVAAIVAGADGIADKAGRGDDLCLAIRTIAHGHHAIPTILPSAMSAMAARLDPDDVPILAMIVHDTPADDIADVLHMTPAQLATRRWAIVERLTHHPRSTHADHPSATAHRPATVPRRHGFRS